MTVYVSGGTEAAINAALAAAAAANGDDVILENDAYNISTGIVWPACDNIRLIGQAKSALVAAAPALTNMLYAVGSFGPAGGTVVAAAAMYATSIQVSNPGSFSIGSLAFIQRLLTINGQGCGWTHVAEVTAINGSSISFYPPLPFPAIGGEIARAIFPRQGTVVEGVDFIGHGTPTVAQHGLFTMAQRSMQIRDCTFTTFVNGSGCYVDYGMDNTVRDILLRACGSPAESDIMLRAQTNLSASGIRSRSAAGFGPQAAMCQYGNFRDISSLRANGRGFKVAGTLLCDFDQIEGSQSQSTGIAITLG